MLLEQEKHLKPQVSLDKKEDPENDPTEDL
jgi:hypothetical protein